MVRGNMVKGKYGERKYGNGWVVREVIWIL